jgi:predicted O-methyltransferase YrrM
VGLLHFQDKFIGPEIKRREQPVIVEIGLQAGQHSQALIKLASRKRGKHIGIDPAPGRRIRVRMYLHRRTSTLIRKVSLQALPDLVKGGILADIVLVDGDHNYYTVSRELLLIDRLLRDDGIVFLHDVCWPYGRRDLYYDPERIPEEWRQQYARKGVIKGQSRMVDEDGLNPELAKAVHEGGTHNGVLTAAEDFVASHHGWSLQVVEDEFGLGILRRTMQ